MSFLNRGVSRTVTESSGECPAGTARHRHEAAPKVPPASMRRRPWHSAMRYGAPASWSVSPKRAWPWPQRSNAPTSVELNVDKASPRSLSFSSWQRLWVAPQANWSPGLKHTRECKIWRAPRDLARLFQCSGDCRSKRPIRCNDLACVLSGWPDLACAGTHESACLPGFRRGRQVA